MVGHVYHSRFAYILLYIIFLPFSSLVIIIEEPDCSGLEGGDAFVDMCGQCVGGWTGLAACEEDCAGVHGGSAFMDMCGACAGGSMIVGP